MPKQLEELQKTSLSGKWKELVILIQTPPISVQITNPAIIIPFVLLILEVPW